MWQRELGVRITIEPYEQKTLFQNQQTMAHTIGTLGWVADFADPITFLSIFLTGGGNNWTGWSNREYDQLLEKASHTADPQTRFEIFQQAEALLLHENSRRSSRQPHEILPDQSRGQKSLGASGTRGIHLYKKVYLQSP